MPMMSPYMIRWDPVSRLWRLEDLDGPLRDRQGRLFGWREDDYAGADTARACLDAGRAIPREGLVYS